ncbi:hypothetical protein O3M35_003234 [Rhynocoris fuscipes]|uniref:Calponin-homology (CH) domain-containing protein n=1 Tax=Rhynocoris fuscipes TaxID=488301 RepID=A0AAW1CPB4_9HEMI
MRIIIAELNTLLIYTDWGNHYLEKARSKKFIQDLQTDLTDGVLLADLIEAVTNQKVPDVQRKPKTAGQMVCTHDIVLSLFYY